MQGCQRAIYELLSESVWTLEKSDLSPVLIEIKRHLSFVGLFPHPVEINVSENEERVVSFVDAA
ncbi:MAG: hypothetical protein WB696_28580, partial [Chthoniobacterales bacterium]